MFSVKSVQSSERKMLLPSGCQTQQTRPGWRVSSQHFARLIKCLELHANVCMKPCLPRLAVFPLSEENLRHFLPSHWRTAKPPSEDPLTHTVHTLWDPLHCFGLVGCENSCVCRHVSIYFRSRWSYLWWCTKRELWINYRCVHLVFIVWCISSCLFT